MISSSEHFLRYELVHFVNRIEIVFAPNANLKDLSLEQKNVIAFFDQSASIFTISKSSEKFTIFEAYCLQPNGLKTHKMYQDIKDGANQSTQEFARRLLNQSIGK